VACTADSDLVHALRMHPDVNACTRDVEDPDERQEALMNVAGQVVTVVGLLLLASMGTGAYAQDLEPRAYVNTPVGLNFLLAGYGYSRSSLSVRSPGSAMRRPPAGNRSVSSVTRFISAPQVHG